MKKGDLKRSSILQAAEMLFFERGYDRTSVQDILDALSLSKGGFYHHFPSKEAVLEEICANRTAQRLDRLGVELYAARLRPLDRLNLILRAVNLLERDDPRFIALTVKICYLDRDVRIRDRMRQLVLARLSPRMDEVLREGMDAGDFFVRHPGQMGWMALNLASDADDEACRLLAAGRRQSRMRHRHRRHAQRRARRHRDAARRTVRLGDAVRARPPRRRLPRRGGGTRAAGGAGAVRGARGNVIFCRSAKICPPAIDICARNGYNSWVSRSETASNACKCSRFPARF